MTTQNSKRPPNELESRLHKAAITDPKNILTLDYAQSVVPDAKARLDAFNWLLSVGLFKPLHNEKGKLVAFRAVTKNEITATKDLTSDEKLVLDHIASSRNEGIWTKTLKAKTNLHQNVVDRCLKSLSQKKLIKRIPAMNNKKIYMLEGLEPSVELTGGAWYTDGELDTGLIHHLTEACLKIIREMSFPKNRRSKDGAVYPISNSPKYPDASAILKFIKKAGIAQVDLTVQDIESLLNVLILDGEIEKLPATRNAFWDVNDTEDSQDENTTQHSPKTRHSSDGENIQVGKRKRGKQRSSSEESTIEEETHLKSSKRKRPKTAPKLKSSRADSKSRRKKIQPLFAEDSRSSSEEQLKDPARRKHVSSSFDDEHSSSDADDTVKMNRETNNKVKRSPSPLRALLFDELENEVNYVYRATRQERVPLGWIEAPCCLCPSFDFCKDGGPVSPQGCVYYGDWLVTKANVVAIEDVA